ncbi:MAG: hypothetical protein MHM6MM_001647 [Cercozoa sp. M6MM]
MASDTAFLETRIEQLEAQTRELTSERDELQRELDECLENLALLETDLESGAPVAASSTTVTAIDPTVHSQTKAELSTLRERVSELEAQVAEDEQVLAEIDAELCTKEEELEQVKAQLEEAEQNAESNSNSAEHEAAIAELQLALDEELAAQEELALECDKLKKSRDELQKQLTELKEKDKDASAELGVASIKTDQLESALKETEAALQTQRDENHELQTRARAADDALRSAQAELEHTKQEIERLKKQAELADRMRDTLDSDTHRQRDELQQARLALHETEQKLHESEAVVAQLRQETQEFQQQREVLEERLKNQVRVLDELREEVHELRLHGGGDDLDFSMEDAEDDVTVLRAQLKHERKLRRKYQDQWQDAKGAVRVFCRVRGLVQYEIDANAEVSVAIPEQDTIRMLPEEQGGMHQDFSFARCFGPEATQRHVYREVEPLVDTALRGGRICCAAYGQTGTGKTYTMLGTPEDPGVTQRALVHLFEALARQPHLQSSVKVTLLEVYNEQVRDLLGDDPTEALSLTEEKGRVVAPDAVCLEVSTAKEVLDALERGTNARAVACTDLNAHSSRSHMILSVLVESRDTTDDTAATLYGRLAFCDLAGSENAKKSGTQGAQKRETGHINKSLSALSDVVLRLKEASGGQNTAHVPYRNSKLTYLLRDCLSPGARTLFFVTLSPSRSNSRESQATLLFGQRCQAIQLGKGARAARDAAAAVASLRQQLKTVTRDRDSLQGKLQRAAQEVKLQQKLAQDAANETKRVQARVQSQLESSSARISAAQEDVKAKDDQFKRLSAELDSARKEREEVRRDLSAQITKLEQALREEKRQREQLQKQLSLTGASSDSGDTGSSTRASSGRSTNRSLRGRTRLTALTPRSTATTSASSPSRGRTRTAPGTSSTSSTSSTSTGSTRRRPTTSRTPTRTTKTVSRTSTMSRSSSTRRRGAFD